VKLAPWGSPQGAKSPTMVRFNKSETIRVFWKWIAVLILIALPTYAWASLTPAGTVIRNQARVVIEGEEYLSNLVETLVQPVCYPSVLPDGTPDEPGQRLTAVAGGLAILPYTIVNSGNDRFDFDISWTQSPLSKWAPEEGKVYHDVNENGSLDPGEPLVEELSLDAGESAQVLLMLRAPTGQTGSAFFDLVLTCPEGNKDETNFSEVVLKLGPALFLEKSFNPTEVLPGEETEVTLRVQNVGDLAVGREVLLSDDLSGLEGLSYMPGSARAPKGVIEYYDGSTWTADEPPAVQSIRLRLSDLLPNEVAELRFVLKADPQARPSLIENRATATGLEVPVEVVATLEVLPLYRHYLGPLDNPKAVGEEDRQEKSALAGQPVCFEHTLLNDSTAEDAYTLSAANLPEGAKVFFERLDGSPVLEPISLAPGDTFDFLACYVFDSPRSEPLTVELLAVSEATGEADPTYDVVTQVLPLGELVLRKSVDPEGTVSVGQELVYTLELKNDYPIDLHEVRVVDELDPYLEYVASDPAGEYDADRHQVIWTIPTLAAGAVWTAELRVRVNRDTPDDTLIENRFYVTSRETPNPVVSDPVSNVVWSTTIQIEKEASPTEVRVGDRVHYVLRVMNPGRVDVVVDVEDQPDEQLAYIEGSASPFEPERRDGKLVWRQVKIAAGGEVLIEYDMRVVAGPRGELVNVAVAAGRSANGAAVATGMVRALVVMEDPLLYQRRATLVGRVFLDFDRDGVFDQGEDKGLAGARVVLAQGLQVLTDAEGRYAFRDLTPGVWLVGLDPQSAPFDPLPAPEALAGGYARRVRADGLTVLDFPLIPPKGWVAAYRSTTLVMGPLRVEKELVPLSGNKYRVVLRVSSSAPLPEFELRDPLPSGGYKVFRFDILEGERTITYDLEGPVWLTDPDVRWRYP